MKPETPSLLEDCVALVVGTPYSACMHAKDVNQIKFET